MIFFANASRSAVSGNARHGARIRHPYHAINGSQGYGQGRADQPGVAPDYPSSLHHPVVPALPLSRDLIARDHPG
jgi:hypothetical protein